MRVNIVKALYAFCKHLLSQECSHPRVKPDKPGAFCPDCGYAVKTLWAMLRCRTCGTKRHPKQELDGEIGPMFKYCQHCGSLETQLIKRQKIHAHEMPYAVCIKEIDYLEQVPLTRSPHVYNRYADINPFEVLGAAPVVDGEVLKKEESTRPRR